MKQKAYVEGNKYFLGKITLESGERYNFISGQRFLFLVFPFLQWFMPIYCWKTTDDVNQKSDISWPLYVWLVLAIIGYLWSRNGNAVIFHIPPVISIAFNIVFGILFVKYGSHKYTVPQGVTLYRVRLYPGKDLLRILPGLFMMGALEVLGLWLTFDMPNNLVGPYFLLQVTPLLFWLNSTFTLNIKNCRVEFLGNEELRKSKNNRHWD